MVNNEVWIKEMISDEIKNLIDKYESMNFPFRTVMIKMNYCYCCNTYDKDIHYLAEDSFNGRFKLVGWLYCDDCKILVNLAEKFLYKDKEYLRYSYTKFLENNEFKFWRISKNKNIKSFFQNCYFDASYNNLIYEIKNRAYAKIIWKEDGIQYYKLIYLSNLIYHNRNFFDYTFEKCNFKNLSTRWYKLIKYEYDIINEHNQLILLCDKKNIPLDIENIIKSYLNNII